MQKWMAVLASLIAAAGLAACSPQMDDAQAPAALDQPNNAVQGLEPAPDTSTDAPASAAPDTTAPEAATATEPTPAPENAMTPTDAAPDATPADAPTAPDGTAPVNP